MRIGISLLATRGHNLWNNGIGQNVYHLAGLLEAIPFVEHVVILNAGDHPEAPENSAGPGQRFPLVALHDAVDTIDVAIEMAGGLPLEWIARFRARGGKLVFHNCGHPYAGLIEPSTFAVQGFFADPQRCDEVWILPKDEAFGPMLRALHRCPVHEVPYLWAPVFLEGTVAAFADEGLSFGYRPGSLASGQAVAAILEPNISPIKMGVIPQMICDAAERSAPGTLAHVRFMNGQQMTEQHSFVHFMRNSLLYQQGKVAIDQRDYFARVIGQGANIVVSHQLTCAQNYLYLDALHGNYPLVHNSPLLGGAGYFYPGSDVESGAAALIDACLHHDARLDDYAARSRALFARHDPGARANRDIYARRLLSLTGHAQARAA